MEESVLLSGKNVISAGKAESIAIDTWSSRGSTGFMFSIYIAYLIVWFSIHTENITTALVALPCPVDLIWLNMSRLRF